MVAIIAQSIAEGLDGAIDTSAVTGWDFVWAALCIIGGIIVASLGRRYARKYARQAEMPANIVDLIGTLIMWVIIPIMTVLGLTFIGLDVQPLLLLGILVIVVFAIGGRALLEAFGAGILLQTRSPFVPGDYVDLHGTSGIVVQVDSRVVIVDTWDGRRVHIPNSQVLREPIENRSALGRRMSTLNLDVEYGTDLERAEAVALDALSPLDAILESPRPMCHVSGFGSSSVGLALRFWHGPLVTDEIDAVDAAARAVYRAFSGNDIVFAFPNVTVWRRDAADRTPDG